MARKAAGDGIQRRSFLKGAAIAGTAAVSGGVLAPGAAGAEAAPRAPARVTSAPAEALRIERPGSDFLVDVLKTLDIEYIAAMPGASFRGLQESVINYGGNSAPEWISALHEEHSAAIAHGYAKAAGKPMGVLAHSTVGLQHAAMAVYNAWCDRVPMLLMAGNTLDAANRRPWIEWYHSAQDPASLLRDFLKWDDQPMSLQAAAESLVRAWKLTITPPMAPTLVVLDGEMQEDAIEHESALRIPRLSAATPPVGDPNALREAARILANAENPLILADRAARTPAGMRLVAQLAEALHAPVVDMFSRLNLANDHPLNLTFLRGRLIREADVVLALEVGDLWGTLNTIVDVTHEYRRIAKPDAQVISISLAELTGKANYQDFQRYSAVDLAITGDVEASLPLLIEESQRAAAGRLHLLSQRSDRLGELRRTMLQQSRTNATFGWDASPVSTARVYGELWPLIKDEPWSLVGNDGYAAWPQQLWRMTEFHQFQGGPGGFGVGYTAPASVGAALANKRKGLLSVAFQPDGDLLCCASVLWTAAHHRIPMLTIMHNNRAFHQEVMHLQRMAGFRGRRPDQAAIGTTIDDPNVDFAKLAQSMGVWAEGPIDDPAAVGPALRRALAIVKSGYPALVDVVTQPR